MGSLTPRDFSRNARRAAWQGTGAARRSAQPSKSHEAPGKGQREAKTASGILGVLLGEGSCASFL